MPTYQYRCTECGSDLEAVQKFTDPALTDCPQCDGQLRKVFSAVGVVFKGSGFYATDSRSSKTASTSAPAKSEKAPAKAESSTSSSTSAPAAAAS
ncbi:FmdB family zinc ribbon protein [Tessaracoccus caeni]|uniref:FmdB family zinc ribbon protein n=1 Tax=Tessaracoccus caeni TaxID=3031239 RepID=UPI0023DB9270|nr:FmdB family zinc ribbon protein [Tessaracoccus caeni]MDF1490103.1 zinc ribbon domain-containing protein [Tessaracoccus caeni]